LIWIRGNRFRVSTVSAGRQEVWGQDEQRRLWIVCGPHSGIRFEHDEVPPIFARPRAYLALDVNRLTKRFLEHFDLKIERPGGSVDETNVFVRADAKDNASQPFNAARLEIDRKTKVIRKMELMRIVDGSERANFTFTLVDEMTQPETIYRLEDNLQPGARIYGSEDPGARNARLQELLESGRGS
jgi:hypothetical protein